MTSRTVEQISVDAYIIDVLMPVILGHDRAPSAFAVYLYLWRQSHAAGEAMTQRSLRDIADGTGLSKRSIQEAVGLLTRRRLISISRKGITDVPVYAVAHPWRGQD